MHEPREMEHSSIVQPDRNRRRGKGNDQNIPDVFKRRTGTGVGEKEGESEEMGALENGTHEGKNNREAIVHLRALFHSYRIFYHRIHV